MYAVISTDIIFIDWNSRPSSPTGTFFSISEDLKCVLAYEEVANEVNLLTLESTQANQAHDVSSECESLSYIKIFTLLRTYK